MTNKCAYIYGRDCNSDCNAYNPWCRKQCSRLDDEGKIADALEMIKELLKERVDDANRN